MPGTDHIKQYSAADIQRYLEGKMLPADMHALEQAALDDPFLADAIEGMQETLTQHSASLIDTHLQDIRLQLDERTRKGSSRAAPVIAFRWWQVAAAAVIVVAGSLWGYNYFQQEKNVASQDQLAITTQEKYKKTTPAPVAASEHVPETADKGAADSVLTLPADVNANSNLTQKEEDRSGLLPDYKVTHKELARTKDQAAPAPDNAITYQPQANAAAELKANRQSIYDVADSPKLNLAFRKQLKNENAIAGYNNKLADNQNNLAKVYNYSNSLDKAFKNKPLDYEQIVIAKTTRDTSSYGFYTKPREQEMNRSRKELSEKQAKNNPDALLSGFISGRETDQANNPLSNALLRVDNNKDFFTDQKGQFKIPVNDSIVNVAVGVTGYYTQNLQLQNNTDNNIALNQLGVKAPNPQLNEALAKVAPGVQIERSNSDDRAKAVAFKPAAIPGEVTQNAQPQYGWPAYQQYLEKNKKLPAGTPEITGTVMVAFQVNKKGTLSDFKIIQSLGKVYDEEAIRLIKAGPSWKLTQGRKAKATVLVHF
jgi:TonB family protein